MLNKKDQLFKREKIKKLQKILVGATSYLYFNNIPLCSFLDINPFPLVSYSKESIVLYKIGSKDYFEYVKYADDAKLVELLNLDKDYLFDYDYFKQTGYHWAAKRGNISTLNILISFGKHINLNDMNNRTPLFLAAKCNNLEAIILLLSYDANPFMINIDGKIPLDVCTNDQCRDALRKNMDVI